MSAFTKFGPSWPLTENYCKNIILLHWPNWRNRSEIKNDDISWSDKLQEFLLNDSCPNFIKADIEREKLGDNNVKHFDEENVDDDDGEQPEWVDLVQPCADFHVDSEKNVFTIVFCQWPRGTQAST
jgi:hypothetical protein